MNIRLPVLLLLITGIILSGISCERDTPAPQLVVHFIDVGQGDAILLMESEFTILIDVGRHDRDEVVSYLKSQNVTSLDLLIGTHPHADHIGQFPQVLNTFPVKEVWMSGDLHTTLTFERALDAILATEAVYREPRAGERVEIGSALIDVLHPAELTGELNEGSLVIRLVYGDVAFLFTGDAGDHSEQEMLERGADVQAQILKAGHHGSRTSSAESFLFAVNPEVAIYSAGFDNPYGHPHREVVERLNQLGIEVYGTDVNGTILVITDGSGYEVQVQREHLAEVFRGPVEPVTECVDANTAGRTDLMQIMHIGEARVDELIRLRPYTSVSEMIRISGIGPDRLQDIQQQQLACVL